MENYMKKLFLLIATLTVFTTNVSAANYVVYYKSCPNCDWSKGSSYSSFNSCMNAVKYSYSFAHSATCKSE